MIGCHVVVYLPPSHTSIFSTTLFHLCFHYTLSILLLIHYLRYYCHSLLLYSCYMYTRSQKITVQFVNFHQWVIFQSQIKKYE